MKTFFKILVLVFAISFVSCNDNDQPTPDCSQIVKENFVVTVTRDGENYVTTVELKTSVIGGVNFHTREANGISRLTFADTKSVYTITDLEVEYVEVFSPCETLRINKSDFNY